MKRGKSIFDNDKVLLYVGTAIFVMLAIAIGIVMYLSTKINTEPADDLSKVAEENNSTENESENNISDTESASTEIGKTVEEQENKKETTEESKDNEIEENEQETSNTVDQEKTEVEKENTNTVTENTQTENQVTETKKEITFVKPVEGDIIGEFAKDNLIYSETLKEWITHPGIDIKADKTSVVKASADGIVKSIVNDPRYGLTVVIEHDDGYETVYSNLLTAEFIVEGEEVQVSQTIGTVGNTASFESNMECHVHFELLKDGEYLDPNIYLK